MRFIRARVLALSLIAALLAWLIPGEAFADPASSDRVSCGITCFGVGWEVVDPAAGAMSTAIGISDPTIKVSQYSTTGIGVPPDPTENQAVGIISTCESTNGAGDTIYQTSLYWFPQHSWAYWDISNYRPTHEVCVPAGQTVVYLGLVIHSWSSLFGTESSDNTPVLEVGSDLCPLHGSGNSCRV